MRAAALRLRPLLAIIVATITFTCEAKSPKPAPDRRNPVILVHGFKDTSLKMRRIGRALRKEGRMVLMPTLAPSWGQAPIEELARQLSNFVSANLKGDARFDLVAFSMGGIVSRYYLQRLGGLERVDRFVAISVPQHGTLLANLCPGFFKRPGIAQLRRGSPLLLDLDRDRETLARLQFTTIWTPLDLMILPASSSRMPIGSEVRLWMAAHPLMVLHPTAVRAVTDALK